MASNDYSWAIDLCLGTDSTDAPAILEELMASPKCAPFGPVHHFLVGASVLTAYRNANGDGKDKLAEDLAALGAKAVAVPGAACAMWGVCGAAASCGMAYGIAAENAPLKSEGWSEGQRMVGGMIQKIADAGSPRCCKRDSRIAVREAVPVFERDFGVELGRSDDSGILCAVSEANGACMEEGCRYYAA